MRLRADGGFMNGEVFMNITNTHTEDCGIPPRLESGDKYLSYFENAYGDQWVFTMDRESKVFYIAGGDIGWENKVIGEAGLKDLILNLPEQMWVLACLQACDLKEVAERVVDWWHDFYTRLGGTDSE